MTERSGVKVARRRDPIYLEPKVVYNKNLSHTTMKLYRNASPIQLDGRTIVWVGLRSHARLSRTVRAELIRDFGLEFQRLGLDDEGWREYHDSFTVSTKRVKPSHEEKEPGSKIFTYGVELTSNTLTENLHETLEQYALKLSQVPGVLGGDVYIRAY